MNLDVIEQEQTQVQPISQSGVMANPAYQILQMAIQKGVAIDQLERLLAMQERAEANDARKAFVTAMAEFKRTKIDIYKTKQVGFMDRNNNFVGYSHAELCDVVDAVVGPLSENGLSHGWSIEQSNQLISVTCRITHSMGHSESVSMSAPPDASGKKNAIQQVASAVSYMQRYTLLAITGLSTRGVDDDAGGAGGAGGDAPAGDAPFTPGSSQKEEPAWYAAESFEANKAAWQRAMSPDSKRQRTLEEVTAIIETVAPLSPAQKKQLAALAPTQNHQE